MGIPSLVKNKALWLHSTTFGPIGTRSGCLCSSGHCTSSAILTSEENLKTGLIQSLDGGFEPAVVLAVAGAAGVLTVAAGGQTLGIGAPTPGIDMKIPETGTVAGI